MLFAFVKMKPFKIIKTVIIMLAITLFIAGNVAGGLIDNAREKEAQDAIPQGVSYLDLKAFESMDASAEYEEQYIEGQTDQAARELFYREDFPTIKVGKNFKVMKSAFIDWCRERRV